MKKNILSASALLISLGLTGCASFSDISESKDYLTIAGHEFRKTGSIGTSFLLAGVKRSGGKNSFDPKFPPKFIKDQEITAKLVTVGFNEQTRSAAYEVAAEAGVEGVANGKADINENNHSASTGMYHVFMLFDVNDFVRQLNNPLNEDNLEFLQRYDDPRIISAIATVYNRKSNEEIKGTEAVTVKIDKVAVGTPKVTFKNEHDSTNYSTLSDGTVFAYEYARICWERNKDSNGKVRVLVATIEVDRPGIDGNCPDKSTDDASDLLL